MTLSLRPLSTTIDPSTLSPRLLSTSSISLSTVEIFFVRLVSLSLAMKQAISLQILPRQQSSLYLTQHHNNYKLCTMSWTKLSSDHYWRDNQSGTSSVSSCSSSDESESVISVTSGNDGDVSGREQEEDLLRSRHLSIVLRMDLELHGKSYVGGECGGK